MSDNLTINRISETFEFLKRQTVPSVAILVSPQVDQLLRDHVRVESILTSVGMVKVFVSSKCPDDYFYAGSEGQIAELLERLESE